MQILYEKYLKAWLAAPPALRALSLGCTLLAWSYQPLINLGMSSTAHLELSFTMIASVLFIVLSVSRIVMMRTTLYRLPWLIALTMYVLYAGASLTYSLDPGRGLALWALVVMLLGVALSLYVWRAVIYRYRMLLLWSTTVGVVFSCLAAWFQIIGSAVGLSDRYTLLPAMYSAEVFGFARPTAWFAEPQFLANFLIIPLTYLLWRWLAHGTLTRVHYLLLGFTWVTFLATLSRGGYIGLFVASVILVIAYRPLRHRVVIIATSVIITAVVTFGGLGLLAHYNQRDSLNGYDSLQKTIQQISLGTVSLPTVQPTMPTIPIPTPTPSAADNTFVQSSTTDRQTMAQVARDVWLHDGRTMLFGVGLGGFGNAAHAHTNTLGTNSVVNNHYLETLAELGVVGFGLLLACLVVPIIALYKRRAWLGIALIMGLTLQWNFFSGYPNVIHIWYVVGIAFALVNRASKLSRINQHNRVS
ncbi:MAG: O-antigen ligase family protein [Candidatus Saccharimonadales bacterium]